MKCCGSTGPSDWAKSKFNGYNPNNAVDIGVVGTAVANALGVYSIPETCCKSNLPKAACDVARQIGGSGAGAVGSIYEEVSFIFIIGIFNMILNSRENIYMY